MNTERLTELRNKVERANKLSNEIEQLTANKTRYDQQKICSQLLTEIWEAGHKLVLSKKEDELEALLNPPFPIPAQAGLASMPSDIQVIGTIQDGNQPTTDEIPY